MTDTITSERRSQVMARIKSRDTKPEMMVRRSLHRMGFRYRLHAKELPGRPDIVFRKRKLAIFVHGCFWHQHDDPDCKISRLPKSRLDFWLPKLEGNRLRDKSKMEQLLFAKWKVRVVWECQLRNMEQVENKLKRFVEEGV